MAENNFTVNSAIFTLIIFKILGFNSFTVIDRKSVTKPMDLVYLVASISLGALTIYKSIQHRNVLATSDSEIVNFGNFAAFIASLLISIISMVHLFVLRHKVWKIVLIFIEMDDKLGTIGVVEDYKRSTIIVVSTIFSILVVFVFISIAAYILDGSLLKAFLYLYSGIYFLLVLEAPTACMSVARLRLITLNKICESILHYPSHLRIVKSKEQRKSDSEAIGTFVEVYAKLIEIQDMVNLCYGVPTMLSTGLVFFYSVFTNFMVYKNLTTNGYMDGAAISGVLFSLYLNCFMVAVIYLCTSSEAEATKTLKLSNQIMKRTKDEKVLVMLMSLNSLIKRNPLKLTCGMFDFDFGLIYSVSLNDI